MQLQNAGNASIADQHIEPGGSRIPRSAESPQFFRELTRSPVIVAEGVDFAAELEHGERLCEIQQLKLERDDL